MGKVTIYLTLVNGELFYRDSEKDHGRTIESSVNPKDKIVWTLDNNSGISYLSGINIIGSCKFFSKGPKKKGCDKWTAKVSKRAEGEIEYEIFYLAEENSKETLASKKSTNSKDPAPAKIKVRI